MEEFDNAGSAVPTVRLRGGHPMPQLGFGVFQVPDDVAGRVVAAALRIGYRAIDTARIYGNEAGVGRAVAESGLRREEVFVTSKLWNDDQGYDATMRAFDATMGRLGLDYLDLYLIHWPVPARGKFVSAYNAMQRLRDEGRIRSIGVSNFRIADLDHVIDATGEAPAVNQIELHPGFPQAELRAYHQAHGIATEAWSPLARNSSGELFNDPTIQAIAFRHGRTPAQVVLRWHVQLGNVVIPKSATPARIAENFEIFGFALDDDEMAQITGMRQPGRLGPDPATFE